MKIGTCSCIGAISVDRMRDLINLCKENNITKEELKALIEQQFDSQPKTVDLTIELYAIHYGYECEENEKKSREMSSTFEISDEEQALILQFGLKSVIEQRLKKYALTQGGYEYFQSHSTITWGEISEELFHTLFPPVNVNLASMTSFVPVYTNEILELGEATGTWIREAGDQSIRSPGSLVLPNGKVRIRNMYLLSFQQKAAELKMREFKDFFLPDNGEAIQLITNN